MENGICATNLSREVEAGALGRVGGGKSDKQVMLSMGLRIKVIYLKDMDTFRSGTYLRGCDSTAGTTLYRVYGWTAQEFRRVWTSDQKPAGPVRRFVDSALSPSGETTLQTWSKSIPKATKYFEGVAALQGVGWRWPVRFISEDFK